MRQAVCLSLPQPSCRNPPCRRDAPDWYRKTFQATGFGLCFCTLKQYLNRRVGRQGAAAAVHGPASHPLTHPLPPSDSSGSCATCRRELEVFLPPRSKVLPTNLRDGYRNSQMLKYGFLKVGKEVTTIAGAAGALHVYVRRAV